MAKKKSKKAIQPVKQFNIPEHEVLRLEVKVDSFNSQHKNSLGYGIDLDMLKEVYSRGTNSLVNTPEWRVNNFILLVRSGKIKSDYNTDDYDMLPNGHPNR